MRILVFNGGSSSLTYKVFDCQEPPGQEASIFSGKAYRVGVTGTRTSYIENRFEERSTKEFTPIPDHRTAAIKILEFLKNKRIGIDAIGHRFVHGGVHFKKPVILSPGNFRKLKLCLPLAPLHNPIALSVIEESMRLFPRLRQFVVFDTAFHAALPWKSYTYAIPASVRRKYQLRKYGFHGLSYACISKKAPEFLKADPGKFKMVVCHLGTGGASIAAIRHGASLDTSMGFSPLSGLVMSTRSGDIDPSLIFYLMKKRKVRSEVLSRLLNNKSGLLGLSGFSSDITDIICRLSHPNKNYQKQARFDNFCWDEITDK